MNQTERERRHDERWQKEVVDGLARVLDVLHDISDGVLSLAAEQGPSTPIAAAMEQEAGPELLSVNALADQLRVSPGTVRSLRASGSGPRATLLGRRIFFRRDDVAEWLMEARERTDGNATRPWCESYLPGRVGAGLPATSRPRAPDYCSGSHTETRAASSYSGRGICRECGDHVLVNRDGGLREHRRSPW